MKRQVWTLFCQIPQSMIPFMTIYGEKCCFRSSWMEGRQLAGCSLRGGNGWQRSWREEIKTLCPEYSLPRAKGVGVWVWERQRGRDRERRKYARCLFEDTGRREEDHSLWVGEPGRQQRQSCEDYTYRLKSCKVKSEVLIVFKLGSHSLKIRGGSREF